MFGNFFIVIMHRDTRRQVVTMRTVHRPVYPMKKRYSSVDIKKASVIHMVVRPALLGIK